MGTAIQRVSRVFVIGIDGAGNNIKDLRAGNIRRVMDRGAFTYEGETSLPTISAECWGAMFHGVEPEKHGLTNEIACAESFPLDSPYPSFFRLAAEQIPGVELAAFSSWGPINSGIIETPVLAQNVTAPDGELTVRAARYIRSGNPTVMFVQLDDVDHAGHAHGYRSKRYFDALALADSRVGLLLDAIDSAGFTQSSLILLCADHGGGGDNPFSHGSVLDCDRLIFWVCAGPGVRPGPLRAPLRIRDTAAVCATALGLEIPKSWDAQVPPGLFL